MSKVCSTNTNAYTTSVSNVDAMQNTIATTSTSGLSYVSNGNLAGNITITPSYTNWGQTNTDLNIIGYSSYTDSVLESFFSYLREEEISDLLDKIIERDTDGENTKTVVSRCIKSRHFSEEFLMKYAHLVSINDILVFHKADICSQNYPQVALLIEGMK